ncbi:hypothetical protein [Brevibacterium sandarakinum]|uniref:hypothetical protein n=1 Tax=Brevibacterium sandarakinum TaxID=629680 RepID=UPI00264CA42E|nr:hypothetical protein [Brevibacterium sandarakinum]MDN5656259.1 hypothetical protein [Brevibacterium sandarakinum]
MKKAIIALASLLVIIAAAVGALFVWEHQSKLALEGQVEDSVDLTYVDLELQDGTNKDQLLVHQLSNGEPESLTRFVTFDHPEGEVDPIERVDGEKVTYSADVKDHKLRLVADGHKTGEIAVEKGVSQNGAAVTDTG